MATALKIPPFDQHNENWISHVHPADWQNPTPNGRYNLVVVGGGTAGLVTAAGAAGIGAKVALIERHMLGGDCLNVGCVPSKAIIRSAKVVGEMRRASEFGIHLPKDAIQVDFAGIMERMRRIRSEISHHDSAQRFADLGVDVYLGDGSFIDEHHIFVDGQKLEFSKAVIATGARASAPPIPGLADIDYLTNENLWELTELPQRLAVIGAGPIGAEMAQSFLRFGSQVTLFDIADQILIREDKDAAKIVQDSFYGENMDLRLGVSINNISQQAEGKVIEFTHNGQAQSLAFDAILIAAGRRPNVDTLNLEAVGVEYTRKGVTVNDKMQTTNPNIYAAGDVAIKYQFTHMADATARIVIQNALFTDAILPLPFGPKMSSLMVPWVTYTDPEIAHVGLYEQEAIEQGYEVDTYKVDLMETDRGRADGEEGFVKVHVEKGTDYILGATIVASHAGEMISQITSLMVADLGLSHLVKVIHPYPTQAEAIRKTADAYNRTRLTPTVAKAFDFWLRKTR